jgi:hypothetical protein
VEVSQTTRLLGLAAVPIRLQRRLNDRIVPTLQFPDKIRKSGRKRDVIHTPALMSWRSNGCTRSTPRVSLS